MSAVIPKKIRVIRKIRHNSCKKNVAHTPQYFVITFKNNINANHSRKNLI